MNGAGEDQMWEVKSIVSLPDHHARQIPPPHAFARLLRLHQLDQRWERGAWQYKVDWAGLDEAGNPWEPSWVCFLVQRPASPLSVPEPDRNLEMG
jgi:hypothetical protein